VRLLVVPGLLAASLALPLVASSTAQAQTVTPVTVTTSVSVNPRPDHVRLGWVPQGDGPSPESDFSVRDNDEVTVERCAVRPDGTEDCAVLTASCGAVFEDMEALFEILDDLSVKLKASWESQDDAGDGLPAGYPLLPAPLDGYGSIGMEHFLQAAWGLLPLEYMFLNWDMAFPPPESINSPSTLAATLKRRLGTTGRFGDRYEAILRHHTTGTWNVRNRASAERQIAAGTTAATEVAAWITGNEASLPEFPVFTLGALLRPATLAVNSPPDTSSSLGKALDRLTGPRSFADWRAHLQSVPLKEVAEALGDRLSDDDRRLLEAVPETDAGRAVRDGLKERFNAVEGLAGKLAGSRHSDALPYQVRAVLAYLKLIIESPDDRAGGFGGGARSYEGIHLMPFHVLFEAPELTAGLLELFGRARPEYRSVRDVRFGGTGPDTFYEQRAESLLADMFEYCTTQLVLHDEQYVRWDDPYAGGSATTGRLARFELVRQPPLTGNSGVSLEMSPASPPVGSMLRLQARGDELGETTMWYCYSFGFGGCAEAWTPVTVLVEPAGWDDARIVIQRDHYHVVVDWHSHAAVGNRPARPAGNVMVFRPSPEGTVTLTDPLGARGADHGISAGRWVNDGHVRDFMPDLGAGWKYELVNQYCCLLDPSFDWSFAMELPVMDNDEVHFYDLADPTRPPAVGNELRLLAGTATCDTSRYCRHVRAHELAGRRRPPGPDIRLGADSAPSGLIATVSARRDVSGRTRDLFAGGKTRAFEQLWLSYCVSPQYVGCLNWTDRKRDHSRASPKLGWDKQGHCVMATSLEPPVAPNAPSLLVLREWARQTGRPESEYYFRRNINLTLRYNNTQRPIPGAHLVGWSVDRDINELYGVQAGVWTMRNLECPALDPQDPDPLLEADWMAPPGAADFNNLTEGPDSCAGAGKTYADAETLKYRAYRRFWRCIPLNTAVVGGFSAGGYRAGHPTELNVFVTLEFISPASADGQRYHNQVGQAGADDEVDAECATDHRPKQWNTTWKLDPAGNRGMPLEWCFPPVVCWNDEGEPMWQNLKGLTATTDPTADEQAALIDRAGCPHHGPTVFKPDAGADVPLPLGAKTDLARCEHYRQVVVDDQVCGSAPAAEFALEHGCIFPSFRIIVAPNQTVPNTGGPPPGHGALRSGHYRWGAANYEGSFRDGAFESSAASGRYVEGAVDPGMALFPVSTGLRVDPSWQFCQGGTMAVVGVWPVHPASASGWPEGACDGRLPGDGKTPADTEPVYEIDRVCESSYPRLYDSDRDPSDGIQLPEGWNDRFDALLAEGVGCVGESECHRWVIPEPGFYRVRILVDGPAVAKRGEPARLAALDDAARNAEIPGLTPDQHTELDDPDFADPPPFVFDKLIWAQSLHTTWG